MHKSLVNAGNQIVQGINDSLSPWERLGEAAQRAAESLGDVVRALADTIAEVFPSNILQCYIAYSKASKEHPQWVRFAKHHRKKRIRKKYHDRIMKVYGGAFDV